MIVAFIPLLMLSCCESMRRSFPINFILLMIFVSYCIMMATSILTFDDQSVLQGFAVASISCVYQTNLVIIAFVVCTAVVLVVTFMSTLPCVSSGRPVLPELSPLLPPAGHYEMWWATVGSGRGSHLHGPGAVPIFPLQRNGWPQDCSHHLFRDGCPHFHAGMIFSMSPNVDSTLHLVLGIRHANHSRRPQIRTESRGVHHGSHHAVPGHRQHLSLHASNHEPNEPLKIQLPSSNPLVYFLRFKVQNRLDLNKKGDNRSFYIESVGVIIEVG